ncbi:hypothetical protein Lfu02_79730 [Longispora fulva]|uniref:Uncharacterized protein n=1 Tax=Longispora fulva TaxID=619741 RepID=A0A8J7GKD1_9ACTN|nr:hypothetical protein [Longispora fulva]MBG6141144.1 hypothetical protein [Longispora fulva]GIG63601.1 hypothetical protein Lfu02_79730 [Longispora fulva]
MAITVPVARTWADTDPLNTTNLNVGVRDPIAFALKPPGCALNRTGTLFNLPASSYVAVPLNNAVFNNAGMYSAGNDYIRIQATGLYQITAYAGFDSNATGQRKLGINGDGQYLAEDNRPAISGDATHCTINALVPCTVDMFIRLHVFHTGSAALNINAPKLAVAWHSAL